MKTPEEWADERARQRIEKRERSVAKQKQRRLEKIEAKDWLKEISEKEGDKWKPAKDLLDSRST